MKSETEIRARLELVEEQLENSDGHDLSHLIGQRNILRWVLDNDSGNEDVRSTSDFITNGPKKHWTGDREGQRR